MSLGFPYELTYTESGLMTVGYMQTAEETESSCSRADLLLDKQTSGGIVSKGDNTP